jgi:hypothetical protein
MRYFHCSMAAVDEMTFDDYWMLDADLIERPPVDWLVASYLGYKGNKTAAANASKREAMKANAQLLKDGQQKHSLPQFTKTLDQLPAFLRAPEMMDLIAQMKNPATS